MRRRELVASIGSSAALWPLASFGQQQGKMRRIGILMAVAESDPDVRAGLKVFTDTLRELGWEHGRNIQLEYRWGDASGERIASFAKELVQLSPDILVAHSTPPTAALRRETRSIPIVFLTVTDPVGQGLVASLAHPGGNITGFAVFEFSLGTKWMEALKQLAPDLSRVTTIFNPEAAPYYPQYQRAIDKAASS